MQELDEQRREPEGPGVGAESRLHCFAAAGAVSYPLYALHYPLAKLAGLFLPRAGVDSMLAVLLCGAGLVLLAYGAWRGFDQPLQAWLKGASPAPARIVAAYPVGA